MSAVGHVVRRDRPGKVAIMRAAVTVMAEDGYEGASVRDMAARAGVSAAALYYHFPSKLDLLREFLHEGYDVILARLDRRLLDAEPTPTGRLDEIVATLVASYLHDEFARLASRVAVREHTRLGAADRRALDGKRRRVRQLVENVLDTGVAPGVFTTTRPRESAQAIVDLCASVVEPLDADPRPLADVIAVHQAFARALACAPN